MKKLAVLLSSLLLTSLSYAAVASIGVFDLKEIMEKAPEVKKINKELESKFGARKAELVKLQKSFEANKTKLQRDGAVMSEKSKHDLQEKLTGQQRELERTGRDFQQDVFAAQNKAKQAFYTKLKTHVEKVAKTKKLDLVLQKEAVIYASDKVDITNAVLSRLK